MQENFSSINKRNGRFVIHYALSLLIALSYIVPNSIIEFGENGGIWFVAHKLSMWMTYLFIVLSLVFLPKILKNRPSKALVLTVVYYSIIVFSTIRFEGIGRELLFKTGRIISLCILVESFIKSGGLEPLCKAFLHVLFLWFVINFITILLFPEGWYINDNGWGFNYFLGYKNDQINYFLPMIFFAGISNYIKSRPSSYNLPLLIFGVLLTSLLNRSTTSLVVCCLLMLCVLLCIKRRLFRWINLKLFLFVALIASFFFIAGVLSGDLLDMSEAVSDMADKGGDSISERGMVWIDAIVLFLQHPIFGNGSISFLSNTSLEFSHAHNQFLDILVVGGIALFFVFCLQIIDISSKMKKINIVPLYNIILFVFLAYFIEFIAEGRRDNLLWFVLLVSTSNLPAFLSSSSPHSINKKIEE